MADDQDEPTLPPHSPRLAALRLADRKQSVASLILSDSSEPAIFSSDDDPAVENYTQDRRKKQYIGTWDRQRPVDRAARMTKRKLVRQSDSGVYMGSDASSIDDILDDLCFQAPPLKFARASQPSGLSPAEAEARRRIQRYIDRGDEYIDLSGLGLEQISNDTIALLSEFECIPVVARGVPFSRQEPELNLFLFGNRLTRLPKSLFDLDCIRTLSLRGNQLTELPPAIFKLKNLKELTLSQMSLKSLPFELLELIYDDKCQLEHLSLHPNPFYQPITADSHPPWTRDSPPPPIEARGNRWLSKPRISQGLHAKLWLRTPVQLSDTQGKLHSDFQIDPDTPKLETEDLGLEPSLPVKRASIETQPKTTKVLSFMELILQTCAQNTPSIGWSDLLDADRYPQLITLLEETTSQHEMGGRTCTVCKRPVVRPTVQWIEWWEFWYQRTVPTGYPIFQAGGLAPGQPPTQPPPLLEAHEKRLSQNVNERLVPFLRQACSWNCVKDPIRGLGIQPAEMAVSALPTTEKGISV